MKSPLTIGYSDLIKRAQSRIDWMNTNHPRLKQEGKLSAWQADHNLACDKILLKMLKQGERGKQLDFGEAFEKVKQ